MKRRSKKVMRRMRTGITVGVICVFAFTLIPRPATAADIARLRNGFTIRHERRQTLGETTRLFLGADNASYVDVSTAEIEGFERDLAPPPPRPQTRQAASQQSSAPPPANLTDIVNSASATYHLDPDLVNSVIHAESGFNSRARSPKGAQGLMQLMPSTAGQLGVTNAFDPKANVGGGTQYLRQLLEQYNFDLVKALAAYNAGPHRVEQYRGVPPYRETRAYVARIVREYNKKKDAEEKQASQKQALQKQATRKSEKHTPQQANAAAPAQSAR
jgi:soluble lytic murein transglycosylase-like protein